MFNMPNSTKAGYPSNNATKQVIVLKANKSSNNLALSNLALRKPLHYGSKLDLVEP